MSTTMTECLENNLVRIQGTAMILDVIAANAGYAASLIGSEDMFTVLSDVLRNAYEELNEKLEEGFAENARRWKETGEYDEE